MSTLRNSNFLANLARGLAVLGRKFATKLLKFLGNSVGSAIAGSAVDRVAKKLFGSGR